MPDINSILKNEDFGKVVSELCVDTIEDRNPVEYREEYRGGRKRRTTSVGWREPKKIAVYSNTLKDKNGDPLKVEDKTVDVARIVTNFPEKLVQTFAALMFGGRMNISADKQDEGFEAFKFAWTRTLGMQDVLLEFAEKAMSETKAAIVFYPTIFEHWSGEERTEINCKILCLPENTDSVYEFYPHFHNGRMDGFIHRYNITLESDKNAVAEQVMIWTREKIITATSGSNGLWGIKEVKNLWGLLPICYVEFGRPYWDPVASVMDAREMRLSRLHDTNDYHADPILKSFGDSDLPSKDTAGKEITFPIRVDDNGREYHGDAEYLSWQQSIDSVDKELEQTKSEQHSGTSMPDLSFDNLKGMGNLSGVSRRFLMLDAEIKVKILMRTFRPALMRCVTIVTAGIANITNIKLKKQLIDNWISIDFESILPKDPVEDAQVLNLAGGGKAFNSQRTVVSRSPLTPPGDVDGELERIAEDEEKEAARNNMVGLNIGGGY